MSGARFISLAVRRAAAARDTTRGRSMESRNKTHTGGRAERKQGQINKKKSALMEEKGVFKPLNVIISKQNRCETRAEPAVTHLDVVTLKVSSSVGKQKI